MGQDNNRPLDRQVIIHEESRKVLVTELSEAVTRAQTVNMLEEMKRYARAEGDLARERDTNARLSNEITQLQARIAQLNGFIQTMSHQPAQYAVPSYDQRYAAAAPLPPLTAQVPAWTPAPSDAPIPPPAA